MSRYQKLLSGKAKRKRELMGKMFFPRTPVLLLDLRNAPGAAFFGDLLKGLESIQLTTLVLGSPNAIRQRHAGKYLHYLPETAREQAYEAADFAMVMDDDVSQAWDKGCVPISRLDGEKTLDYNPLREKGNGFYFKNPTKWEVFAAVVRAVETYQFPYDWENLIEAILSQRLGPAAGPEAV